MLQTIKQLARNYVTDHRTANTIELVVGIKVNFSGLSFFRTSRTDGEFSKD